MPGYDPQALSPSELLAQTRSMMAVSDAVSKGGPVTETLDVIARETARISDEALATSIILLSGPGQPWHMGGSYGLSEGYADRVEKQAASSRRGVRWLSELTVEVGAPILISDTEEDPRYVTWRDDARAEGFRSFMSVPLGLPGSWLGSLNVYRRNPGAWPEQQVEIVRFFAQHAATAIRTAHRLESQASEVASLRHLVRALNDQTHEHANRLHTVSGLLTLGELDEARQILDVLETTHHQSAGDVRQHVRHPALAGLLLADAAIANQRSIRLEFDPGGGLPEKTHLTDAQLITITGNLLDNAFDAVADMPPPRRRVRILLADRNGETTIRVRDWGAGLAKTDREIFRRGATTRAGHAGIGLTLVKDTVAALRGSVDVRHHRPGTSFTVIVPHG